MSQKNSTVDVRLNSKYVTVLNMCLSLYQHQFLLQEQKIAEVSSAIAANTVFLKVLNTSTSLICWILYSIYSKLKIKAPKMPADVAEKNLWNVAEVNLSTLESHNTSSYKLPNTQFQHVES